MKAGPTEIVRHHVVKRLLFFGRDKLLRDRDAIGVADVFDDLPPERAVTYGGQTPFEFVKEPVTGKAGILGAKALGVAESVIVNDADQPVEFHKGILKRRCRQQNLGRIRQGIFERPAYLVVGAIHIAQPVGLVDHREVPGRNHKLFRVTRGELERANDQRVLLERSADAVLDHLVVILGFENECREKELFLQLLRPLLAQVRRSNDQNSALPLGPFLGQDQASLYGLSKSDFIGEDRTFGKRGREGEERGLDLMGIEVHLSVKQRTRKLLGIRYGVPLGQFIGEKLCVVFRYHSYCLNISPIHFPLPSPVSRAV